MHKPIVVCLLSFLVLITWNNGACQTVVENSTTTQTINQPTGTQFNINGVETLLWPGVFRIASEGGPMVLRDMSQSNAWYMVMQNLGNSTGDIEFFGGFTNHGSLIPNGGGGNIGTDAAPWARVRASDVVAEGLTARFISKLSGQFRIDHPLDPLHKYLQHSFVESPDMKNVYDGIAILDKRGEIWVTLPDWFEALNSDFRYQLTSIGTPNPSIYIGEEVSGNRFKIAGGKPGAKVSWQITGIRQDAYAKDHRIKVEEMKPADQQGKLIYDQTKDGVAQRQVQPFPEQSQGQRGNQ
jgi:hypothetical protein